MKKFISLIAVVAMMTSMIVSVSAAESKMTVTTTPTKLTNETYAALTNEAAIPSGFEAYKIVVSASNFGTLDCVANEFTGDIEGGRRLGNFVWSIDFGSAAFYNGSTGEIFKNKSKSINSEMQAAISANEGTWDLSAAKLPKWTYSFGATSTTAYPATSTSLTQIDNIVTIVVVIKEGTSITGTVNAQAKIKSYPSEEDEGQLYSDDGSITLSQSTITLGETQGGDELAIEKNATTGVYEATNATGTIFEGKKLIFADITEGTITADTRVKITNKVTNVTKQFGGNMGDLLAGNASLTASQVKFGLLFDDTESWTAANFTFELVNN